MIKFFLLIQVEPNDKGIKKALKKIIQVTNETFYKLYFFLPYLFKKRQEYMTMYNNDKTTHKADLGYMFYKSYNDFTKTFFTNETFVNVIESEFEELHFPVPKNYDEVLKILYGGYMEIPKDEDKKTHKIEII